MCGIVQPVVPSGYPGKQFRDIRAELLIAGSYFFFYIAALDDGGRFFTEAGFRAGSKIRRFFFYGRRRLLRVHKVAPDSSAVEFSRFQLLKQVNRVRNIESAGTGGKKLA